MIAIAAPVNAKDLNKLVNLNDSILVKQTIDPSGWLELEVGDQLV